MSTLKTMLVKYKSGSEVTGNGKLSFKNNAC